MKSCHVCGTKKFFYEKKFGKKEDIIAYSRNRNIQSERYLLAITEITSDLIILQQVLNFYYQSNNVFNFYLSFFFIVGMDRLDTIYENETSILCLLDSIKLLLTTTERRFFMGANRQSIDVSFTIFYKSSEYEILNKFINEMFFVPLHGGINYFSCF